MVTDGIHPVCSPARKSVTPIATASTATVTHAAMSTSVSDSPLMYRMNIGKMRKNSIPTVTRNSTGAISSASFTSGCPNRLPDTSSPRACSSQNRTPPTARNMMSI